MQALQWIAGAVMCFGSFVIIRPIARWWIGQHGGSLVSPQQWNDMSPEDRRIYDARQQALYETGETFGGIVALCLFIGGIIVGNI